MAQHQQYNYTSNFQGQELGDAQLRLNVNDESFDYQPSGPDVEIDIDTDLVIDGTITFEEFRTEYFAKDRPVWLKTGGMYQMLVPFLGINPDGYYEFARISDDGSSVMWWHLSQDGWTHGTTEIEQTTMFDVADLPGATDPMSDKAFKIATCKLPDNIGEFTQCELFLQLIPFAYIEPKNHDTFKFRVGIYKYSATNYNTLVEPIYNLPGWNDTPIYLEKLCISINNGYAELLLVQKTGITLSHLVITAAITNNIGRSKTPWYLSKGIMESSEVTYDYNYYSFNEIANGRLQNSDYRLADEVDTLNTYNYISPKALGSFIPTRTYGVARTYTEGVGNKYAVIATFEDNGGSSDIFASHFCVQVATNSGKTNGKRTCGTFHIFISGVGGYARNIRCWWESVTTDSELSGTAPKSMHLVKDGDNYSLVLEFTNTLNGGATSDVAFITVLQNATRYGDTLGHMAITNGGWVIPITSWKKSGGSTQRVNTTASLPAGTDTEYLFADGTSLHSINQNGIVAGEDVLAPFMYKVSTPTFNYPGRQGFFGLSLAAGKSYIAKITLIGQTNTKAVVAAIDTTANDVRLRYVSGDVGIVDYTDNDDPDDTNYLKFFKSDDGDGHYYLAIKCGYVNAYETCTATVELVCLDYSQNSSPISAGTSLSTGTWPTYAQNRTQKFAAIDAPKNHASAGTEHGVANSTDYGHVKTPNRTVYGNTRYVMLKSSDGDGILEKSSLIGEYGHNDTGTIITMGDSSNSLFTQKQTALRLYRGANFTQLYSIGSASNNNIKIPDKDGTLLLSTDLKSIVLPTTYCNGRIAKITWDSSITCIPFVIKFMFDYGTLYHDVEEITCYGEINGSMNSTTLYIWGKSYSPRNPNGTPTSSLGWINTADGIEIWASQVKAYAGAAIPSLTSARFILLDVKCPSTNNVNIDIDTSFTNTWTPTVANSVDCN